MAQDTRAALDLNVQPDYSTPFWSETRWNCCWCPDAGVGVYQHAGRFRKDLDVWWIHVAALLPDGRLAVDRAWCLNEESAGLRSENLTWLQTETGWRARFDGVGELTSIDALARSTRGDAAPSVRMRWEVNATNAADVWDMYSTISSRQTFASDIHLQQSSTTAGTLTVDGESYDLTGCGFKDHSSGARDWSRWHSHRFMLASMEGHAIHAVTIFLGEDGADTQTFGVAIAGNRHVPVKVFEAEPLADRAGGPREFPMRVTGPDRPVSLKAELVHCLPITISEANDNLNGVANEMDGDPIVMIEGMVRLTAEDGEVGYGFFERSARRSSLPGF